MRQVLIHRSSVTADEVPAPVVQDGHALVEVGYSLISAGTEMSVLASGQTSPKQQLSQGSERLKMLTKALQNSGPERAVELVRARVSQYLTDPGKPIGYSCSGVVVQVGKGVEHVRPGDQVACAGAGSAHHAEFILGPSNLLVKIPEGCSVKAASSVAIGAIALQGVRRAQPQLGEVIAVVGLGLIGQLTIQLLRANGCRVFGFDLDERRVELAAAHGIQARSVARVDPVVEMLHATQGHGADAVIVTAAANDRELLQQAARMCRRKGRLVLVGAVPIQLDRSPLYDKEIDFLISCSYGPGRYDPQYEREGVDYPYAFVRWTEQRNMEEYLRLIASGRIDVAPVLEREFSIEKAEEAYAALSATPRPLGVVLQYQKSTLPPPRVVLSRKLVTDRVGVALVGAGNFARGTLLKQLENQRSLFHLRTVVSRGGASAHATATRFGADIASTRFEDVLEDDRVHAVIIATRHDRHAAQVTAALRAGKHVYCEKPLCLNLPELESILAALGTNRAHARGAALTSGPVLAVGFNRRFSPAARLLKEELARRSRPAVFDYRVNAGFLPPEDWTHGAEGGGRLRGEACHMIDLLTYFAGALPESLSVESLGERPSENAIGVFRFGDGSVGTLTYTALGSRALGKERVEAHFDGRSAVLDDFKELRLIGSSEQLAWSSGDPEKGHRESLAAFGTSIVSGGAWPIPLSELVAVTETTLAMASLASGGREEA